MHLSRRIRILTAVVALISLLFAQLAVAAHACDGLQPAQHEQAMPSVHDMAGQQMDCCADEVATADPSALCHEHCDPGSASLDRAALPGVVPFIPVALVYHVVEAEARAPSITLPDAFYLIRTVAPPLAVRNCCFRI